MKKYILMILIIVAALGTTVFAGQVNLALREFGGYYYVGASGHAPAVTITDMDKVFDGSRSSGYKGLGTKVTSAPGEVYRVWCQDVTLNQITLEGCYRYWDFLWDSNKIVQAEAFYRNSSGSWVSLGLVTNAGAGADSAEWNNLGSGSGVTTDAIKIKIAFYTGSYCIVNEIKAFGPMIDPSIPNNNIALGSYVTAHGGTVTATGSRAGSDSNNLNDGDNGTVWSVYNSSHTDPGYWELNWGRDMKINAILVSGGLSASMDQGANADIEIFANGSWRKVENGSAGTSGFTDSFYDGTTTAGWGGNEEARDGGEFYGTSLRFGNAVVASKIRVVNFDTTYNSASGGANYIRELMVYGEPSNPDCSDILELGLQKDSDINKDCKVNLEDFAMLAADWMQSNQP